MTQIRITLAPPVDPKHGITVGREFETCPEPEGADGGTWIMGDAAEKVRIWSHEFEMAEE